MRRELKDSGGARHSKKAGSFSSCPDEEGTESLRSGFVSCFMSFVSAVVPMRRELKEIFP